MGSIDTAIANMTAERRTQDDFMLGLMASQVQRPLVQAQVARMGAEQKAQELQNQLTADVMNPMARRQAALQMWAPPMDLSGPLTDQVRNQATDVPPSGQPSAGSVTKAPGLPAQTGGDSTVAGTAGFKTPANTQRPVNLSSTAGGSPVQGTPPAPVLKTTINRGGQVVPSSQRLAPVQTPVELEAPAVPAQAPAPAPAPEVAGPAPAKPVMSFYGLSPAAQAQILEHGRGYMKSHGFDVNDAELISRFQQVQQGALPPITPWSVLASGMVPTKYGKEGFEFVNPFLTQTTGSAGRPQQYMLGPTGEPVKNEEFLTPEKRDQYRQAYSLAAQSLAILNRAREVIEKNPEVYGKNLLGGGGGTVAGKARFEAEALAGNPKHYDAQRALDMESLKGMLDTLSNIHIGRVTELEWGQIKGKVPQLTDSKKVWDDFFQRSLPVLQRQIEDSVMRLTPYGEATFPQSDPTMQVTAPGQAGTGKQVVKFQSGEQVRKLPSGTLVQMPDGRIYPKL